MKKSKLDGRPAARFVCPECGTMYRRPTPLMENEDGTFEFRIFKTLELPSWTTNLRELWSDPNQTWPSLARLLGRSRGVLRHYASKMDLPDMPRRVLSRRRSYFPSARNWIEERDGKRRQFAALIRETPSALKAELRRKNRSLYTWIEQFDPDSLLHLNLKSQPFWSDTKKDCSSHGEWDQRCAAIVCNEGPKAQAALLKHPQKLSVTSILKIIDPNRTFAVGNRRALPRTRAALAALAENEDDHFNRLFGMMREEIARGNRPKTINALLEQTKLRKYFYRHTGYASRIRAVYYGGPAPSAQTQN